MKIIHKVSLSPNDAQCAKLDSLGISLEELTGPLAGIVSFEIDESHQAWLEVEELILGCHPVDIARTEFTASERKKASYLWMVGNSHHGYPQPEGDFGYLAASYDLTEYCAECGVGKRQVAPLRMRGEPKWGRRHILQMNWVFEEFFVRPDVWETVFKEMGIGYMPVVKHHTDKELQTVVQLEFKTTAASRSTTR